MSHRWLFVSLLALAACAAERRPAVEAAYEIVRTLPHDPEAFTQGLVFLDGKLLESTGLYGRSSLREVEIDTGAILRKRALARRLFGEGLAVWSNRVFQLTWREGIVMIYDASTLDPVGSYSWEGEGWGLAVWSNRLVASDGTARLRFFDPATMEALGEVVVTDNGRPVHFLNELETVRGELWANVWQDDRIARIDPSTGRVIDWIDFSLLVPAGLRRSQEAVLNGIAYDADSDRIFITGKNWPVLYEIRLKP